MPRKDSSLSPARPDTLSLFMLSSFRILMNGKAVNGRLGEKTRQLLKVLAANHRKCLPKDFLIEALWPEGDPASGATSLKVAVHNLRSALEPNKENGHQGSWIIVQDGTYRLNPNGKIWIDIEAFREHYERGRALQTQSLAAEARGEFEKADELYTGDYLEEDMYADWTMLRREELRDVYLDLLCRLATLADNDHAHSEVIRYCHKIVLADPCREDAYRWLIRSHAALNQVARAGAWYAVCRVTLRREVGVSPSAETAVLFESLFEQNLGQPGRRTA
jgi:DNA-binding SARP family transcriptional activator